MVGLRCSVCNREISFVSGSAVRFCPCCGTEFTVVYNDKKVHGHTVNICGIPSKVQALDSAKTMISIGEYRDAEKLLENIVSASPDCGEAWLGLVYLKPYNYENRICQELFHNIPPKQVKQKIMSEILNSPEMRKAKKLVIENIDTVVLSIQKKVRKDITQKLKDSKSALERLNKNVNRLDGFFCGNKSEGEDKIFFLYEDRLHYYAHDVYYTVLGIDNGTINIAFDFFKDFHVGYCLSKTFSIKIIQAADNMINTSDGYMRSGNSQWEYIDDYKRIKDRRKKQKLCPICGGKKFFSCVNNCSSQLR